MGIITDIPETTTTIDQELENATKQFQELNKSCAALDCTIGNKADELKDQKDKEKDAKEEDKTSFKPIIKDLKAELKDLRKELRETKKTRVAVKSSITTLNNAKKELEKAPKVKKPKQVGSNNALKVIEPEFDVCEITNKVRKFYAKNIKRDIKKIINHKQYKCAEESYKPILANVVYMINKAYSRVTIDADTYILGYKKRRKRQGLVMTIYSLQEFRKFFSNVPQIITGFKKTDFAEKPIYKNIADAWFENENANDAYNGIDLQPDLTACGIEDGFLNIWQGFGVNDLTASKDDVQLVIYLNHMKNIICGGNEDHYNELLRFLAHLRQYPEQKAQYAVVLESEEHGTGKSTFLQPLLTMCGMHGAEIQKGDRVFGKFNSRLANLILAVLEEAFAGSQEATNALKNLITSYILELERKSKDVIELENYIRLILTTNQKDILKIDATERRYFYLKVSAEKLNDEAYFETLDFTRPKHKEHLQFVSKLSFFLNNYELPARYIPRNPPATKTLGMKKLKHLEPEHLFIYNILSSECNTLSTEGIDWKTRFSNKALAELYFEFKRRKPLTKQTLQREATNPIFRIAKTMKEIGIEDVRFGNERGKEMYKCQLPRYKKAFSEKFKLPEDVFQQ